MMNKKSKKKRHKNFLLHVEKPHEILFEPNVTWKDAKKYCLIDLIEVILETEYEIINENCTDYMINPRTSQELIEHA